MDASQTLVAVMVGLGALNLAATAALAAAVWQVKITWTGLLNSLRQLRKR